MRAMHGQAFPLVNAPDEASSNNNNNNNIGGTYKTWTYRHEQKQVPKAAEKQQQQRQLLGQQSCRRPLRPLSTFSPPFKPPSPLPPHPCNQYEMGAGRTCKNNGESRRWNLRRKRRGRQSNYPEAFVILLLLLLLAINCYVCCCCCQFCCCCQCCCRLATCPIVDGSACVAFPSNFITAVASPAFLIDVGYTTAAAYGTYVA